MTESNTDKVLKQVTLKVKIVPHDGEPAQTLNIPLDKQLGGYRGVDIERLEFGNIGKKYIDVDRLYFLRQSVLEILDAAIVNAKQREAVGRLVESAFMRYS